MKKCFSIYVCTYNGEKVIAKCLDAILKLDDLSTLVDKVVVVDNNSNDSTAMIVKEYSKKNIQICYEFEKQQGLSYARRHAAYADTEWVIYVDDDNILDSKWLVELNVTVNHDSQIGVVNGAVIALPSEDLTESEKNCLHVIYRDLACTHLSEDSIDDKVKQIPKGAGMCVRTAALKRIHIAGWLNLVGRTGEKLLSGEDGELCNLVFQQGYKYCFNSKMKLMHLIPKSRLQPDYVNKLIYGLVLGRIEYLKTRKNWMFEIWLRKVKYTFMNLKYFNKVELNDLGSVNYWNGVIRKMIIDSYLMILK